MRSSIVFNLQNSSTGGLEVEREEERRWLDEKREDGGKKTNYKIKLLLPHGYQFLTMNPS
jgi:hypothetical protein